MELYVNPNLLKLMKYLAGMHDKDFDQLPKKEKNEYVGLAMDIWNIVSEGLKMSGKLK